MKANLIGTIYTKHPEGAQFCVVNDDKTPALFYRIITEQFNDKTSKQVLQYHSSCGGGWVGSMENDEEKFLSEPKFYSVRLTQFDHLNDFAELLLNNGFTLIIKDYDKDSGYPLPTWFHFWKDGKLGYVQSDKWERSSFSTVHYPCKDWGTGFRVDAKGGDYAELTIDNALKAFKTPNNWGGKTVSVKKYTSPEEYANAPIFGPLNIITPNAN